FFSITHTPHTTFHSPSLHDALPISSPPPPWPPNPDIRGLRPPPPSGWPENSSTALFPDRSVTCPTGVSPSTDSSPWKPLAPIPRPPNGSPPPARTTCAATTVTTTGEGTPKVDSEGPRPSSSTRPASARATPPT